MPSKIRERILTTAVRRFAANGFHGTSTKDIATCANVTEGSLFRLYESKEKLFCEALSSALSAKKIGRTQLRLAAFALLEGKGLAEHNAKFRRIAAKHPIIHELCILSKP